MYYVLIDTDESGGGSPIGIFDSPNIDNEMLSEYFGDFKEIEFIDIRDSGIEWQKIILTDDGEKKILTMHYFLLNEL